MISDSLSAQEYEDGWEECDNDLSWDHVEGLGVFPLQGLNVDTYDVERVW